MPAQAMETQLHQLPSMPVPTKHDATTTIATEMYHLNVRTLPASAAAAAGREQCPRCASRDTKFCYYNNYNTSQPRHFCRACRRYWTLGGSLRNVPIGGSTRKRPRPAPAPRVRPHAAVHFAPPPPHGLLGSLFALGAAAPLLEGRASFDLGLGMPCPPDAGSTGAVEVGLRSPAGVPLLWPAGELWPHDAVDTWKVGGTAAVWPEPAAAAPAGGLHGGPQLL